VDDGRSACDHAGKQRAIRRGEIVQQEVPQVCHSFVTDGRIQYLSDCTHAMAGQTKELADWPAEWDE
jgi:hypothetical protein